MTPERRAAARRSFPSRFGRILDATGTRNVALARTLGVRVSTISEWRTGKRFPRVLHAEALGDLDPSLSALIIEAYTLTCELCGITSVQASGTRVGRFCSRRCKSTDHTRREREGRAREGQFAKRRLALYQDVVGAFCRQCEPAGGCRDADCHLREVSPLPLLRRVAA